MPLRITLSANERLIVGGAVVRNGGSRADLLIENDVPILRGKEVMSLDEAKSPCRRIYFAIQLMYVDEQGMTEHTQLYWQLVKEVLEASPSMADQLTEISAAIADDKFYQALKLARKLIVYEGELISHVARR